MSSTPRSCRPAVPLTRLCWGLLLLDGLLAVAHLLWPEYRWGQGRRSYFNFGNSLTLASWLTGMQFVAVAVAALTAFHRERRLPGLRWSPTVWVWPALAMLALVMSLAEITRIHRRLDLFGYGSPDPYEQLTLFFGRALLLLCAGFFLRGRLQAVPTVGGYGIGGLLAWTVCLLFGSHPHARSVVLVGFDWQTLLTGVGYLVGGTLLLAATAGYALLPHEARPEPDSATADDGVSKRAQRAWLFVGVAGTTCALIFLQVLLFRMLTMFGDYLTAYSVISIALLGIAVGGLIGFSASEHAPGRAIIQASLLLPFAVLLSFGACVSLSEVPFLASLVLMLPFVCGSVVITVALVEAPSHLVYCLDLLGAACGAMLIGPALNRLLEEGSFFVLAAFACLASACLSLGYVRGRSALVLAAALASGATFAATIGVLNRTEGVYNVAHAKVSRQYSQCEVVYSASSLVGRFDVIRREPDHSSLSAYENGRITDTLRGRPTEDYRLDPRVPNNLIRKPSILIIGLSGDGITKTAKCLGGKVTGLEINPVVVKAHRDDLAQYNANSYAGIEVEVIDGRSYLQQTDRRFDMITLMNAHLARGRTSGRSPSPEYLHTREALGECLDHLTDRGVLIIEEPCSYPRREVPVWKAIVTLRQVLLDRGAKRPEDHVFAFQWKTERNNYMQLLVKRDPFTRAETRRLTRWVDNTQNRETLEARAGRRLGPIWCRNTLLHVPYDPRTTNYTRLLRGEMSRAFLGAHNLRPTTDDQPFHFDVDPARKPLKRAYATTLLLTLLLAPFFLLCLAPYRAELPTALPYVLVVVFTGLGYLLLEVVLMHHYQIFLGTPVVAFTTVLGTLLICSGLGSLWSGRLGNRGALLAIVGALAWLVLHMLLSPGLFRAAAGLPLPTKVLLTVGALGPLAFLLGVPFPYVMRAGRGRFTVSAAAMLFALNGAGSALAVALEQNLALAWGLRATALIGLGLYALVAVLLLALERKALRLPANAVALAALALLVVAPWLQRTPPAAARGDAPRVYALSYGESRRTEDRVLLGGDPTDRRSFEWLFWLICTADRTMLVDTGSCDEELARQWRLEDYTPPTRRLRQLGVSPSEVDDVILTHAHWDHAGDLRSYPNATIWLQAKEYDYLRRQLNAEHPSAHGMRLRELRALLAAEREGRLRLVHGEHELRPGITMAWGGGHTPGSQYVTVETRNGLVVIAGDLCNLYANSQKHIAVAGAWSVEEDLTAIRAMLRRAASPFFVLPGHDPRVLKWFREVDEGIVEIDPLGE